MQLIVQTWQHSDLTDLTDFARQSHYHQTATTHFSPPPVLSCVAVATNMISESPDGSPPRQSLGSNAYSLLNSTS